LKLFFAWYDFWIGVFVDRKKKLVYVCPIPMFGVIFSYQALVNICIGLFCIYMIIFFISFLI